MRTALNRLRFGPYRMPRCKIGGKLDCEYAGTLRIVAISDAPQQGPLGVVKGHRIPVVCLRTGPRGQERSGWGRGHSLGSGEGTRQQVAQVASGELDQG